MIFIKDILPFARTHKKNLLRYFYGNENLLDHELAKFTKHELNALLLLTIEHPMDLCRFLKLPFDELQELINNPVYEFYTIKKKKSGERPIHAPNKDLKSIQKRINYFLQAYYLMVKPNQVHGFVVNPHYLGTQSNIVENAKAHIGKKYVLNIDLKDFFPSIKAQKVKQLFTSNNFKYSEQIANAFTLLTTYEGKLPIGSPTSPVISNFICLPLDWELIKFSNENNLTYTRYADDLTFSSDRTIPSDTLLDIINLIKKHQFEINEKKLRLTPKNRKQSVTGITVNDKVNVDRKLLKKIRAMLHQLKTEGLEVATREHFKLKGEMDPALTHYFILRLRGYINFVGQVRGKGDLLYIKWKKEMEGVMEQDVMQVKSKFFND